MNRSNASAASTNGTRSPRQYANVRHAPRGSRALVAGQGPARSRASGRCTAASRPNSAPSNGANRGPPQARRGRGTPLESGPNPMNARPSRITMTPVTIRSAVDGSLSRHRSSRTASRRPRRPPRSPSTNRSTRQHRRRLPSRVLHADTGHVGEVARQAARRTERRRRRARRARRSAPRGAGSRIAVLRTNRSRRALCTSSMSPQSVAPVRPTTRCAPQPGPWSR